MKDQRFVLTNTTKEEYKKWCKENGLDWVKSSSYKLFFREVRERNKN